MELEELLARLTDTDNPIEDMPAFIGEITKAHTDALSVRDAAVTKAGETLAEREAELTKAKLKNYDLMMKQPADLPGDDKPADKADEITGIDSLFEN